MKASESVSHLNVNNIHLEWTNEELTEAVRDFGTGFASITDLHIKEEKHESGFKPAYIESYS